MDEQQLTKISKALADPTRFRILQAIAATSEICCGDIAKQFPIAQATVSHHLKVLTEAGLVASRREGQHGYFRALREMMRDYRRALGAAFDQPTAR